MIEINKDYYCSGNFFDGQEWCNRVNRLCIGVTDHEHFGCCPCYHRKHPTPEQFKQEYGFEYPDNSAVYTLLSPNLLDDEHWVLKTYIEAQNIRKELDGLTTLKFPTSYFIICCCTPCGCPPADWRPK
ncbi:MAG: hypothetical protein FWD87_11015 [Spirochaetaceae bacterium]|nr:hypothetical protein [Spirochaetaceae bacterium]